MRQLHYFMHCSVHYYNQTIKLTFYDDYALLYSNINMQFLFLLSKYVQRFLYTSTNFLISLSGTDQRQGQNLRRSRLLLIKR